MAILVWIWNDITLKSKNFWVLGRTFAKMLIILVLSTAVISDKHVSNTSISEIFSNWWKCECIIYIFSMITMKINVNAMITFLYRLWLQYIDWEVMWLETRAVIKDKWCDKWQLTTSKTSASAVIKDMYYDKKQF